MISQYSKPGDIDREFWDDHKRAKYWLKKMTSNRAAIDKVYDSVFDVLYGDGRKYAMSEVFYYTSPKTGNRWMMWMSSMKDDKGMPRTYCRYVLYYFTAMYMTIMLPVMTVEHDDDTGEERRTVQGVNIYTAHMFQRMADPDRLGVDMTDRVKVIRNFVEFVATGWSDTRKPKENERHEQVMLRTPASWIRGHTVRVGCRHVTIYRTFYADKSMTPGQRHDVKTFRKFADEMIKQGK